MNENVNQKALKRALGPFVSELLEIERDAAGVDAHLAAIPGDVPKGQGPEDLLRQCQARIDLRFEGLTGTKPGGFVSADDCRVLLKQIAKLAESLGVEIDVGPLPQEPGQPWTASDEWYEPTSGAYVDGGLRVAAKFKFAPGRKIRLSPDGSLKR